MKYNLLVFLIVLTFSNMAIQCFVEARTSGFSIELIHRYSQKSPFFNHSKTHGEIALNDALRSIARSNHFLSTSSFDESKIESQITSNGGDYLMKLSIGSPPVEALAVADTGSDLVWVQCQPCEQCYPQNLPIFNPVQSSSYMPLSCDSKPCQALQRSQCGNTNECDYLYGYGGGSRTSGVLATDTVTFDSTDGQVTAFPNTVFGCGNNNAGQFTGKESGLVGLGSGPLSLVSQLGDQIQHKFSYCLLPSTVDSGSKLKFGADAVLSGTGVVSTPILSKNSDDTFYYLNLEAVSVGNQRIENGQTTTGSGEEGNIIIDSGTTLNILETNFYNQIEVLVQKTVGLGTVQGPRGFKLCYDKNSFSSTVSEFAMVFHFTGADVTLKRLNIFRELDDITCLAMVPKDGLSIYGNIAQINFQVGYDLEKKQVSFAPADCTNN